MWLTLFCKFGIFLLNPLISLFVISLRNIPDLQPGSKNLILSLLQISLGNISNINILPLILREVRILGVNAESSSEKERKKIFQFFKSPRLKRKLLKRTKVINLKEVSRIMNLKTYDKKTLRYVVKI